MGYTKDIAGIRILRSYGLNFPFIIARKNGEKFMELTSGNLLITSSYKQNIKDGNIPNSYKLHRECYDVKNLAIIISFLAKEIDTD